MKNPLHILLNITRRFSIKRRFRLPSIRLPSIRLPSIRLPHIPFPHIPFRFIRTVLRKTLALMLLLVSGVGFYVLVGKPWPLPLIHGYFHILGLDSTQVYIWLRELYTEDVIWRSAIGSMSFALVTSLILLVQRPMSAVVAVYRGMKASPMAMLRSPITFYRKAVTVRNWILEKYEYLNSESAKWKTTFNIMKSPYSLLRAMGFSPQMAVGLLFATSTVGGGVIVNETILSERSFSAGDAGHYNAPLDTPVFADQEYNTLRLDLGATSVGNITIENISLGTAYTGSALPSGESNVIYVGGIVASSNPTFNQTYLEVGHLIIDRWRCERLDISHSEIHTLIISGNASDGQSISAVAGTPRDRGINGGNRADDMTTRGGYYDMLKITSASSGVNGKVDVLRLSNLYSKGGACTIKYVKAGTMEVTLNEIGGDESLSTKAFTIATSVVYKNFTNTSNVEVSMAVPAAQ